MRLHHFTDRWAEIDASGVILANWRNKIGHFSASDDPAGLPIGFRERRFRITVEVPDAEIHWWIDWANANLENPGEVRMLTAPRLVQIPAPNDPPDSHPDEWYVIERGVPRTEWLRVDDLHTSTGVWQATDLS